MLVGYMRVSSADDRQSNDLQRDALIAAGVDERHLHADKASGCDDRRGLKACLADLRAGDCLVVWKLDRLGRSLPNLLSIVADLKKKGVAFRSLTEQMDTTILTASFCFPSLAHGSISARLDTRAGYGGPGRRQTAGTPGWPPALDRL